MLGALALSRYRVPAPPGPPLTVFRDGAALRSHRVAPGFAPAGDKRREGDGRSPEGRFPIALPDAGIADLRRVTPLGTEVEIRP